MEGGLNACEVVWWWGSGQPVAADGKSLVTFNASLAVSKLGVNSQQASNVPAQLRPGAREWNAAQHAS